MAMASATVGSGVRAHMACLTGSTCSGANGPAIRETIETRPSRPRVVRAMALAYHGRWVSRPQWARPLALSLPGASGGHTLRIWTGSTVTSVHRKT
jgi:hypothetical protein